MINAKTLDDDLDILSEPDYNCCDCGGGFWTNIYSEIVYSCREGCSGSLPRDFYSEHVGYLKHSALHEEVIAPLRQLLNLENAERDRLNKRLLKATEVPAVEQARIHLEREKAIRALLDVHRLTDFWDGC